MPCSNSFSSVRGFDALRGFDVSRLSISALHRATISAADFRSAFASRFFKSCFESAAILSSDQSTMVIN
jgi:hypothetical protein